MHDSGSDRAQTVAALGRLLPALTKRGFTFATVHDVVGMASPVRRASLTSAGMGLALIASLRFIDRLMTVITWLLFASGVLSVARAVLVVVAARRHRRLRAQPWGPPVTGPASAIIPAYNESAGIEATVRSIVASDHPEPSESDLSAASRF